MVALSKFAMNLTCKKKPNAHKKREEKMEALADAAKSTPSRAGPCRVSAGPHSAAKASMPGFSLKTTGSTRKKPPSGPWGGGSGGRNCKGLQLRKGTGRGPPPVPLRSCTKEPTIVYKKVYIKKRRAWSRAGSL